MREVNDGTASLPKPLKTTHLTYLDGIRGLAALYVVLHHAYSEVMLVPSPPALPALVQYTTNWLQFGRIAVSIFIVLSGYCLMLPVARSGGNLRGGFTEYLKRRARRILPPYYAALLLFLLMIAVVPAMHQMQGVRWDSALPAFTPGAIISHLFLVHNLRRLWIYAIDPPMWSVAVEWQIYFLFPLLLLPLWRRFGNAVTLAVAFFIGLLPELARHVGDYTCPWFLGLFALGMVAAALNVTPPLSIPLLRRYSLLSALLVLTLFIAASARFPVVLTDHFYLMDTAVGLATASFLIYGTTHCYQGGSDKRHFLMRLLESRACVTLGIFSYSLYLIHFPLLSLLHLWIRPLSLSPTQEIAILLSAGTLLSLGVSYVFHLLVERRFMSLPAKAAPVS